MRRLVLALLIAIFIAPAVSAVIAACGSVAASDVLAGDISGAGTCLTVTADNVEIDCLGFTIEYKTGGGVNGFGITASHRANITIRNCNISAGSSAGAFGHALQLLNITNMTLVNSNISTNGTFANFGMNVTNSTNFTVFNNSILTSSSTTTAGSFGMQFSGSRLINVSSNRIFTYFDDSNFGVSLQTVNHTLVANNLVRTGNLSSNFGIFVQNMLNVTIIDNDIVTTGDFSNFGILASTTASLEFGNVSISGNNITTWTSESSNFGIDIEGLNGVTIQNNTIRTNGSDSNFGILTTDFLGLRSRNITIQSNSMVTDGNDCCNYGVNIDSTENATVAWNVILTNGSECCNDGVITTGSTFNITIANNSISVNGTPAFSINVGVDLFGGPNTTVSGNNITTNGTSINEGIFTNEDNTTIINNFIITDGTDDTNWGIQAFTALYVNIINNTIFTNGTFSNIGIEFDGFTDHGIIANNTIYTDGTMNDNHGIQFDGISNNSVSGNHIFTSGTNSYGINITASSNITFNNNILNNTVQWIFSHTTGFANYTNTTFFMPNGSVRYNGTFALAGLNNITHDVLNISFNNSFVNSTAEPELNTTAFITLNGLPFADPKPVVDYEDDGTFAACSSPQCDEVSYAGGIFVFNVSSFTSYAAQESTEPTPTPTETPTETPTSTPTETPTETPTPGPTSTPTPAPPPPPSGGGGGGGGRGGTASVCDTLCQSPLYENSPQCLRCKQVQQPTCIEQWKCDAWSDCNGGQQFRSCQDIASCGTYTFRPATQQACGPQTEKPTYQPELTIGTEEKAEQVESAPETVTRKQATKTLDIAGISISSKHAPVIAGVLLLYAILLVFIVWHNRHKQAHKKK